MIGLSNVSITFSTKYHPINIMVLVLHTIPRKFKRLLSFPFFQNYTAPLPSSLTIKVVIFKVKSFLSRCEPFSSFLMLVMGFAGSFQLTPVSLPGSFHLHLLKRFWGFRIRTVQWPVFIHGLSSIRFFILIASGNKYKAELPMSWTPQRWDGWGRPNATSHRWVRDSLGLAGWPVGTREKGNDPTIIVSQS